MLMKNKIEDIQEGLLKYQPSEESSINGIHEGGFGIHETLMFSESEIEYFNPSKKKP